MAVPKHFYFLASHSDTEKLKVRQTSPCNRPWRHRESV